MQPLAPAMILAGGRWSSRCRGNDRYHPLTTDSRPPGAGAGSEQRLAAGGGAAWASAWWPGGRGGRPARRARAHPAGRRPLSALLLEVVVHGGAVHADGLGDLGDGVQPLAIRSGGMVHALDGGGLSGAQLGLAAPGAAAGAGGVQALAGALDDQLALELIDRAEDMEDEPPGRRGRVDLLLQDDQADAALAQLAGEREQVLQRPHRAGQPGDDQHVAFAQVGQRLVELGAGGELAEGGVGEDLVASVGGQVIDLAVVVLAAGGHPRVSDLRHYAGPA